MSNYITDLTGVNMVLPTGLDSYLQGQQACI